jgi:predicted DNA-binding transcriptional regulator YafY
MAQTLQARKYGCTLKELALEWGVSERTVRRDVEELDYAGFHIEKMRIDNEQRYVLDDQQRTPVSIAFNPQELASLLMSWKLLLRMEGTPFNDGIDSLMEKVRAAMPEPTRDLLENLNRAVWAKFRPHKDHQPQHDLLGELQKAAQDLLKVKIEYKAYGRPKPTLHTFHPYRLVYYDGAAYLTGWSEKRKALRTFSIDRIVGHEMTNRTFEINEEIDLDRYLDESFGIMHEGEAREVSILFSARVAQHIQERNWHPSQKITKLKDGSVRLKMSVPGFKDVLIWVLGFGPDAEIESPPDLRNKAAEQLRSAAERYA